MQFGLVDGETLERVEHRAAEGRDAVGRRGRLGVRSASSVGEFLRVHVLEFPFSTF